jgi:hypothetical protein
MGAASRTIAPIPTFPRPSRGKECRVRTCRAMWALPGAGASEGKRRTPTRSGSVERLRLRSRPYSPRHSFPHRRWGKAGMGAAMLAMAPIPTFPRRSRGKECRVRACRAMWALPGGGASEGKRQTPTHSGSVERSRCAGHTARRGTPSPIADGGRLGWGPRRERLPPSQPSPGRAGGRSAACERAEQFGDCPQQVHQKVNGEHRHVSVLVSDCVCARDPTRRGTPSPIADGGRPGWGL